MNETHHFTLTQTGAMPVSLNTLIAAKCASLGLPLPKGRLVEAVVHCSSGNVVDMIYGGVEVCSN